MFNLAVLVGSLRKESLNKKLALALAELGKTDFKFDFIKINALPLFNEDLEHDLPGPVTDLIHTVKASDAVLILTPEYNRDIPGVLKNALDWGSRPYGKGCWIGKCVAITGMSPGNVGTAVCQTHLRSQLSVLGMLQMPAPEICLKYAPDFFEADGSIAAGPNRKFLGTFMTSFAEWIKKHQ
jgi:chromate reductase